MKYLLDTDTLIDMLEDRGRARQAVFDLITSGADVALCPITVAELYSGLTTRRRVEWENWLTTMPYWHISFSVAMQAGVDRKEASETGRTLQLSDSLIAALARQHDATILTNNIKDYPHPQNRVLSLRKEAT